MSKTLSASPSPSKAVKAVIKPSKVSVPSLDPEYGDTQFVTSMRLKRREVVSPYYGKFYMPDTMYVWLNQLGISMGVTWDEALRGLCEMHRAANDQTGGLTLFVPALS
ncbi:MAG TPA: hypothetical protein VIL78_00700 [Hanamia sp.]